jgi:DNA-binding NtrC family response regulator
MAENLIFAVELLRSDLGNGPSRGMRALELAEQSESAAVCRLCLGNLGNYFYLSGDHERAIDYFERASKAVQAAGERNNAVIESMARVRLSQGHIAECEVLLNQVQSSINTEEDRHLYAHRHTELTQTVLLSRQGRIKEAIARADLVLRLSAHTGDGPLSSTTRLTKAELLQRADRLSESTALIDGVVSATMAQTPEVYIHYERVVACRSLVEGDSQSANAHYKRGKRIARATGNVPAEIELDRSWSETLGQRVGIDSQVGAGPRVDVETSVLDGIAALVQNAGRVSFVARELVTLLGITNCVYLASATTHSSEGVEEILEVTGDPDIMPKDALARSFVIGVIGDRIVRVTVRFKPNIKSAVTLNAVTLLVAALQELEQARAEREERATLWPVEELPVDGSRSVISGHMRELMNYARRIAKTNVNVLITGESGTGKEILARAIHDFSDRAQRPFVPFNCTAIPRDLLESQLFGHRRGAFTGADRDHAGLIRAAREGTLFLDEIGELGLDLQPKLLRFLESGEIAPLGEPALTIDVRIVAATNNNLEDAVRAGKFREDLFYRLNVVRLSLRPLRERRDEIPGFVNHFVARAAEEFNKGHLRVAEETMERLLLYRWPGNVRQLHNELRRMGALAEPNSTLLPHAISDDILGALPIFRHPPANGKEIAVQLHDKLLPTLARIECEMIKAALCEHHGKLNAVATALGISRKGLYLKRQRFGL